MCDYVYVDLGYEIGWWFFLNDIISVELIFLNDWVYEVDMFGVIKGIIGLVFYFLFFFLVMVGLLDWYFNEY